MNTAQWIQIIFSGAMFAVTGVLAWATWKYMRFTKRMADSMNRQSIIMSREYELKVSPLINIIQQTSVTSPEKGTYPYIIENLGMFPVNLRSVYISIWHPENRDLKFSSILKRYSIDIAPENSEEIVIEIVFAEINEALLNNQTKKEVLMQPIFRIFDAKHELKTIAGPKRTIWT
jgi:hypothetical protein